MSGEWMLKDDWDEIEELGKVSARLKAEVERLRPFEAEAADLRIKIQAAVSVLLEFAGRLGVGDDELADRLADAEMRAEPRP
jgi:hypothetical protein